MAQITELLKAIGILAWPALVALALYKLLPSIQNYFARGNVSFKIGNMEISLAQATESISNQIKDLQDKVLELERRAKKNGAENVASALHAVRRPSSAPRILWVDDNPSKIAIQVDKLSKQGILIDFATTTAQGMERFATQHYDLVITDLLRTEDGISKPEAGIQLATEIRKHDPQIPIIAFSSYQSLSTFTANAQKAGIDCLTNSTVDLYQQIDTLLGKKQDAN